MPIISETEINQARKMIYEMAGIHLPSNKDSTIKNRLEKLARDLKIENFNDFFMQLKAGRFKQDFINSFTTNKTDFFREGFHFLDMVNRILPHRLRENEPLKVYCSASSTGEEPYSIAATLLYAKDIYKANIPISLVATDIDTSVLEFAKQGKYVVDTFLNPLPTWLDIKDFFEIAPKSQREIYMNAKQSLKNIITFKQHNLYAKNYAFGQREFDIIFCRNVLIYFKVEDQEKILNQLFSHLKVGGTLYLGHSESILGLAPKVERLGQNIFIKTKD